MGQTICLSMLRPAVALAIVFSLVTPAVPGESSKVIPQAGYSTETLRDPVFDSKTVAQKTSHFSTWFAAYSRDKKVDDKRTKNAREELYRLIDSHVKYLYQREGRIFPQKHDPLLEILFSSAEALGAHGGALVYNAIKFSASPEMPREMKLPDGMTLELKGDLFKIRSEAGEWHLTVPYYFMIWRVSDTMEPDGLRTQVVAISTGTARDRSEIGYSSASLMLVFTMSQDFEAFNATWKERVGIRDGDDRISGVRGLRSFHHLDPDEILHKEFVSWPEPQGIFAVVYSGKEGSYQWNRPHFLDFLKALKTKTYRPEDNDQPFLANR